MALNVLDRKTREVMAASYAIPDLETAVQQVIYNAIDAQAKRIRLSVNVADASFLAVDDGDGIQPDDLHKFVGECYASSRASPSATSSERQQRAYGSRGAFLFELTTLAKVVEIESRVQEHWTSWRKVFKEGQVVFNAASKQIIEAGTKMRVSDLFGTLPVRRKDLLHNRKYRRQVAQNIHSFCVCMSMIWPSLSLDIHFEGEEDARPVIIPGAKSCLERFQTHFGQMLGDELQYVTFSSKRSQFSIRGYFAFIPGGREGVAQGIKQAKSYYQFAFLENEWVPECQQMCSRVITDAALKCAAAIPIFVLKIAAPNDEYDILRSKTEDRVLFKAPEQFQEFLLEFVQSLIYPEESKTEVGQLKILVLYTLLNLSSHWYLRCILAQCGLPLPVLLFSQPPDRADGLAVSDYHFLQMSEHDGCSSSLADFEHTSQTGFDVLSNHDADTEGTNFYDESLFDCDDFLVPSAVEDRAIWQIASEEDYISSEICAVCYACGQTSSGFVRTGVEDSDVDFHDVQDSVGKAIHLTSEEYRVDSRGFGREDQSRTEGDLEDIFFSSQTFVVREGTDNSVQISRTPWLSSKPDAYDCADAFLHVNEDSIQAETPQHYPAMLHQQCEREQAMETQLPNAKQSGGESHCQLQPQQPVPRPVTSTYFDEVGQGARRRWSSLATIPVKRLSAALQVDNVHILNGLLSIKISKSTLADMKVIRQVDRKFILVQADTPQGKLLLCIDQHAADERVRLEKLEEEMFGCDGTLRRVETQRHEPPLVLRMNAKECEILHRHEELIDGWGFNYEFTSSESAWLGYVHDRSEVQKEERVLLYATPRVEKRVANGDDFRDFIQLLASAGDKNLHSNIRPPVITRLLHSRACRSAIMFGDYLSTGQCTELIEELKTCQLPFQCAHGRPSVVPLTEIQRDLSRK